MDITLLDFEAYVIFNVYCLLEEKVFFSTAEPNISWDNNQLLLFSLMGVSCLEMKCMISWQEATETILRMNKHVYVSFHVLSPDLSSGDEAWDILLRHCRLFHLHFCFFGEGDPFSDEKNIGIRLHMWSLILCRHEFKRPSMPCKCLQILFSSAVGILHGWLETDHKSH